MQQDDLSGEALRKSYITKRNTSVHVFIYIICQCHGNEAEANLRSGHVDQDMSESELNVRLLFPCLPSEGRLVMRHSAVDRDAWPSAGATGNLSKLK